MHYQKYNACALDTSDGHFDSKREYQRWLDLKREQESGAISDLKRQVTFELVPKQALQEPRRTKGRWQRNEKAVCYVADFVYWKDGIQIVEDVKGLRTDVYKIKRKLMLYIHGIQIRETT